MISKNMVLRLKLEYDTSNPDLLEINPRCKNLKEFNLGLNYAFFKKF